MNLEKNKGVTLIELMIGMLIGLMVLGAIISVYLSARQTATTNDTMARMQENGRFALELISSHVAHAGYFGVIIDPSTIQRSKGTGNLLSADFDPPSNDCETDWFIDFDPPLRAYQGATTQPYSTTCVNNVSNSRKYRKNSDLLEIRNANTSDLGDTAANFTAGKLYVRGDFGAGELFEGSMTRPSEANFSEAVETHEVFSSIYYVAEHDPAAGGDFVPYLMRAELRAELGKAVINNYAIYPGIEQMQIEMGIDVDGDCDVDFWQPPGIANNQRLVTALRVWILVRAEEPESAGFTNKRTYQLGDFNYDPPDDRFRRLPMVKTMKLRNMNEMRPDLNDASEVNCQ